MTASPIFQPKMILVLLALTWAGTTPFSFGWTSASPEITPHSIEPMIEKNDIRVALRATLEKKNQMMVLVKVSNFSSQSVLVSPNAVEMSTEEGFVILPSNGLKETNSEEYSAAWSKISKAASLIPFSDPYKLVSRTQKAAEYAQKNNLFQPKSDLKFERYRLHDVILAPGTATHGLIVYDSSMLKAFDYSPKLRIKVTVNQNPFEFVFDSTPLIDRQKS